MEVPCWLLCDGNNRQVALKITTDTLTRYCWLSRFYPTKFKYFNFVLGIFNTYYNTPQFNTCIKSNVQKVEVTASYWEENDLLCVLQKTLVQVLMPEILNSSVIVVS